MTRLAARAGLVTAFMALLLVVPAALFDQVQGTVHTVTVTHDPALLAVAGGTVLAAYAAYLLAWRALR